MCAQLPALRAREHAIGLLRERKLGLRARQLALELLAERPAPAEDQRLDRAHRQPHDLRDLGVGAALELAHHERGPLVERELAERALDVVGREAVLGLLDGQLRRVLEQRQLRGPALQLAEALAADVVRDRDQPVLRLLGPLAALERAIRVQERRLGDVLRVGPVVDDGEGVAVDVACVAAVDALERTVGILPPRQHGRHV